MTTKNSLTKNRNSSIIGAYVACNKSGKLIGRYVSGVMHQRAPLILSGKGSFCVPNKIKNLWPTLHQKIRQQNNRFDERSHKGKENFYNSIITQSLTYVKEQFCVTKNRILGKRFDPADKFTEADYLLLKELVNNSSSVEAGWEKFYKIKGLKPAIKKY